MREADKILREIPLDPLYRKYFPRGIRNDIMKMAVKDQELSQVDLVRVGDMNAEQLRQLIISEKQIRQFYLSQQRSPVSSSAGGGFETIDIEEPMIRILIEKQGTEAKVMLNEPLEGMKPFDARELRLELVRQGVVKGIRSDYISRLAKRPVYGRKFKVAEGRLPVDGEDGKAVFHFEATKDPLSHLDIKKDTNFRTPDRIKNVKQGDLLCEITPPTPGVDGEDVFGTVLPAEPGKPVNVKGGENTMLSPDGLRIYASCDGQVRMRDGEITVSDILVIPQVDSTTGNVGFTGTILIEGDVAGGFSVIAGGDIIVNGIVEDARLISGGSIILHGGMKGRHAGSLSATGSIRSLFIENADVAAGDSVYAEVIMNSKVVCGNMVDLDAKNGYLLGGECVAGKCIKAYQIGNVAHVDTHVCIRQTDIGGPQLDEVPRKITLYQRGVKRLAKLAEITVAGQGDNLVRQFALSRILYLRWRFNKELKALGRLAEENEKEMPHTIEIRDCLYPFTTLEIDGALMKNMRVQDHCMAANENGKIKLSLL